MVDPFFLLSIPLDQNQGDKSLILQHITQQQALSDLLSGRLSAKEYLEKLESTGVNIDQYAEESLPLAEVATQKDLIYIPSDWDLFT